MKSNLFRSFFMLALALVSFGSCKKDIGNYNYRDLNQLQSVEGISEEVVAVFGKQIILEPKVKFTLDTAFKESDYTYEWSYLNPNTSGDNIIKILSTEKNLNISMAVLAGSYVAYYSITDKISGVKYRTKFTLKVVNEINEGWIMMNEVNGNARVDMLSLNSGGQFELINDLLTNTGSQLKLEGKPIMTYTYNTGLLLGPDRISYGLYFGTDQGTTKVDPNVFRWTRTMGLTYEMFGDIPSGFYADVIQQAGGSFAYMIGKGKAYNYQRTYNIYYSAPISIIQSEGKEFEVAPFVGGDYRSSGYAIFYDTTNKRFVKHTELSASCTILPEPSEGQKLFSFKPGMDMAYMRWVTFNGGEVFSILKNEGSSKKYLARFKPSNNVQTYYSEITGTDIANAELYAVSPEYGYIFYSVGGKVYEYDMVYKTSKLMIDLGSKRVSYLNFYEFKNRTKYSTGNRLMVGSYDPSINNGTEGTLAIYTVPGINADLILNESYSGFGRIKSLTYRER